MKQYPKYKDSGIEWIGKIPEGWDVERAKYIFKEINERSVEGSETLLSVSEYYGVKPKNEVIEEDEFLTHADTLEGYKKCLKGDIIMNIMLAWKKSLGISNYDGIVSPAYAVFRCLSEKNKSEYFHYLFRTDFYAAEFKRNSTGIIDSRLRLYPEEFLRLFIIKPYEKDEEIILKFLDKYTIKIEVLVSNKEKLIELLKEKRQVLINNAVTKGINSNAKMKDSGIEWIGKMPELWQIKKLKYICDKIKTGSTPPSDNKDYYEEGTIDWFTPGDFKDKLILDSSSKKINERAINEGVARLFKKNSIFIIGIGGTLGKVSLINEDSSCNQQINSISLQKKYNSKFFTYFLYSAKNEILRVSNASTIGILNQEKNGSILCLIPDSIEQQQIVDYIETETSKIDKTINKIEKEIELLKEYKTSLIYEAVTGKIDLRSE